MHDFIGVHIRMYMGHMCTCLQQCCTLAAMSIMSLYYVTGFQLPFAQWPQNVTASSTLYLHVLCSIASAWPWGEKDLILKLFTQDEIMLYMLTFVRSVIITDLSSRFTGQLGQHQHHPAVLPWSPPAVSRGVTPGGRAGRSAGIQSSRCEGINDLQRALCAMYCHIRDLEALFLPWCKTFFAVEAHRN